MSLLRKHVTSAACLLLAGAAATACSSDHGASSASADRVEPTTPAVACTPRPLVIPDRDFFADISDASGIRKDNFVPNPTTPIPINDHSRLAFADIDGDGRDDIVMHNLFPNAQKGVPFEHLVFLSNGDKTFRDFSEESGLKHVQAAFFVFADVDNDGDEDCFAGLDISLSGQTSALYLNDGHGHFTKKENSGLEVASLAANAVFADFNGDGKLDVYIGRGGTTDPVADMLFFGNGDGTFTDVSKNLGIRPEQPTNGVVACDYDNDGDLDIFVSHYGVSTELGWNALWENDGTGHFTNVAKQRGFHALATGNYWLSGTGHGTAVESEDPSKWTGNNGFGIDCQDIDGDGNMDIWLAAISHPVESDLSRKWSDPTKLLLNQGAAGGFGFKNEFLERGLPFNEGDIDAAAIDFDNDGRIDLAVTRDKKYESSYGTPDQKAWLGLMHQESDGKFSSVGLASGINDPSGASDRMKAGQNMAWADIDGDGDLDLLVGGRDNGGQGRANFLFENTIGNKNGWVGVRLRGDGKRVNRDAIGARVTLTIGERRFVREVKSSRGTYSSADSRALLFGIGDQGCEGTTSHVSLDVRWPTGETMHLDPGKFALNRYLEIEYPSTFKKTASVRVRFAAVLFGLVGAGCAALLGLDEVTYRADATGDGGAIDGAAADAAQSDATPDGGCVARDEIGPYNSVTDPAMWKSIDLAASNATARLLRGGAFDGKFLYLSPGASGSSMARFDTAKPFESPASWDIYSLGTDPPGASGEFSGMVFADKLLFMPTANEVVQLDPNGKLTAPTSWEKYDLRTANGGDAGPAWSGGVADARFVYVAAENGSARFWRYTRGAALSAPGSWTSFDPSQLPGGGTRCTGAVFDGSYVYFAPSSDAKVVRYDPAGTFGSATSWSVFDVKARVDNRAATFRTAAFDGRYVYFVAWPTVFARFDTKQSFGADAAWETFSTASLGGLDPEMYYWGAAFDGRYMYFVPHQQTAGQPNGTLLRYDTTAPFSSTSAWTVADLPSVTGLAGRGAGFAGALFDGKYVYLIPNLSGASNGTVARFEARPSPRTLCGYSGSFY